MLRSTRRLGSAGRLDVGPYLGGVADEAVQATTDGEREPRVGTADGRVGDHREIRVGGRQKRHETGRGVLDTPVSVDRYSARFEGDRDHQGHDLYSYMTGVHAVARPATTCRFGSGRFRRQERHHGGRSPGITTATARRTVAFDSMARERPSRSSMDRRSWWFLNMITKSLVRMRRCGERDGIPLRRRRHFHRERSGLVSD